ncbi:Histidine acid phosphatase family protein [Aphelenchoides avenae]|nr:Histidine acid phosphatase family protein [Aphelenchus avenae]
MRHGHRAPGHSFPTDPYQESYWPLGFAELTAKGMEDQMELGQWMRQRYVDELGLLSKTYDRREVYVRSTDIDRAILSGQCQMVGLYRGSGQSGRDYPENPAWPTGLITVPIHTVPRSQDKASNDVC